ncbi:MAG TPA: TIR domain-containing protein [Pyrinomonadaceae bacterium]|nr:TIR domain-containing protein [Pyrinomonadaceae bacterium]
MKICPTCQRTYADESAFCLLDGMPLQASAAAPLIGQVFDGKYEIEALIAQTRTGQLYRARNILFDSQVALKLFRPELRGETTERQRSFQREWQAARRFSHPNAVTIYDLRAEYMVLEYVEGQTLDKELRQRGRFTPLEVLDVLRPVASALKAAHASGVNCDFLTPADIMIGRVEDAPPPVKLLPLIFNQRSVDDKPDAISTGVGFSTQADAAPYVAPKLWDDETPPVGESDVVYSLGVISYELMAGQKPYDGVTPLEIAQKQLEGQLTPLSELAPGIPSTVARVIERALAKEGKDRPATVGEFVAELRDALGMNVGAIYESSLARTIAPESSLEEIRIGVEIASKSLNEGAPSTDAAATNKPLYTDENVQFTVYQPEVVVPARWHTLLAFAHLSKRRPDAPPDEPEPLAEVERIAARVLADETADYDSVKQNSLHAVPHKGEITFVPDIRGCEFNPPSQSFSWQKSVHKVEFEMRAAASLDGQTVRGRLTVFLGSLILADVPLVIRVDSAAASANSAREAPSVHVSVAPFRKIFPSYSHKDRAVVEQIEHHVHSLGDKYLRDVTELRAGQDWQRWMRDAIREADVFQLFWSHNSMHSVYVRQEWEYALSLGRPNFVRPTYWEVPLPESPAENLPPDELRRLHFQHLRANSDTGHMTQTDNSQHAARRGHPTERAGRGTARDDAQSDEAVVCAICGGRNLVGMAFCLTCGGMLSVEAQPAAQPEVRQSLHQPAKIPTQEVDDTLDIFWEKRKREVSPSQSLPPPSPQSYSQKQSDYAASGGSKGCSLLLFVLLFVVYLLVRFL